jgi:hypothetical protein
MIRIYARAHVRSPTLFIQTELHVRRSFSSTQWRKEDPRLEDFGRKITDDFAVMREKYGRLQTSDSYLPRTNAHQQRQYDETIEFGQTALIW